MRNTGTGYVNFTTVESALAAREDFTSKRANEAPTRRHSATCHSPRCTPY